MTYTQGALRLLSDYVVQAVRRDLITSHSYMGISA